MYDPSLHTKGMLRSVFLNFLTLKSWFVFLNTLQLNIRCLNVLYCIYIVAEMKAGVTAINCIKNTSFRAILRLFGRAARHASAGSVERSCTNKTACYESRSARVWRRYRNCIELCLSTAARASSIYFSRPPQVLILIRQRVTQLHWFTTHYYFL